MSPQRYNILLEKANKPQCITNIKF